MGQTFAAYGLRFGVRANDAAVLAAAQPFLPLGWTPIPNGAVDLLYSLCAPDPGVRPGAADAYQLYVASTLLAVAPTLDPCCPSWNSIAAC